MSVTDTLQSTPRTVLGGVVRGDVNDSDSCLTCFVFDCFSNCTLKPLTQFSSSPGSHLVIECTFGLGNIQFLHDEDRIGFAPVYQSFCNGLCVGFGSVVLFVAQPFEETNNRMSVLPFCLPCHKFSIQSLSDFSQLGVFDTVVKSVLEKHSIVYVCCDNDVSCVPVYSNRKDSLWVGNFNCERKMRNKFSMMFYNVEAVNTNRTGEPFLELFWDCETNFLSSLCRPNREFVFGERCVPSSFSNQEKSMWCSEIERFCDFMSVSLGSTISSCRQSYRSAFHLGVEFCDVFVRLPMKFECRKRVAFVETWFGEFILRFRENFKRVADVLRVFYDDWNRKLNQHEYVLSTNIYKGCGVMVTPQFLYQINSVVPSW